MRNFEQRKAEVFRRSEERIHTRRKQRNCILAFCVPFCLILAVLTAGLFPTPPFPTTDGGIYPPDPSIGCNSTTNGGQTNPSCPLYDLGINEGRRLKQFFLDGGEFLEGKGYLRLPL